MKRWLQSWTRWWKDRWQAVRQALRRRWRSWVHWGKQQGATLQWNVSAFFSALARPFVLTWRFFRAWWQTRTMWDLLGALPALLLGGTVIVLGSVIALDHGDDLRASYQRAGNDALRSKNFALAQIIYERLTLLDGDRPEDRYALAVSLRGSGDDQRGQATLAALAPTFGPVGFGPAHFDVAKQLLARASPENVKVAEIHLKRALRARPDFPEAHLLLAQVYLQTGRFADAEPHLLATVNLRPENAAFLAGVYQNRGDKAQARIWAEKAVRVFEGKVKADPVDIGARINWAEARIILGDYAGAAAILQGGLDLPGAPLFRDSLARTCVLWIDSLPTSTAASLGERLAIIEQGLKYQPDSIPLLVRLVKAGRMDGAEGDKARAMVQEVLASGKATASSHLILGMDALERQKLDQARQHFELAYQLDPKTAVVANNLAWVLATTEPVNLPRALEMISSALASQPKEPYLRGTRGHILTKMGRWKEALPDLEAAVAALPKNRELHKSLETVYDNLGMPDLAAQHRKLADGFRRP